MRVLDILHDSIVDGKGLRTVIFFAGCPHFCQACHNSQSWNRENGLEWTEEAIFMEIMKNELTNVTFSGGEPFLQSRQIIPLAQRLKREGKNIWCYTGYQYEELTQFPDHVSLLNEIDVLVDGKFDLTKRDLSLDYKGSSNQRVINVPKSLKNQQGKIILA
ncbi:anaerobic ribonucleoside-triphosphate reductase activating protein [Neobacillus drentensis]|uniref:anaerobic ribonucleoside-triphosphate reductase activating protein n=1 Tax=Neobacillus drentensis TaxID=220684 RepID=UPI002855BF4E|nr:anaerobic ribonucleoside-triphosphate reductase activating protein [Neobacillus drentensis]MDR7240582.1 anaerobic ribonucleoside-triphosphate reductase activating protein [Neobacillus drentensis]